MKRHACAFWHSIWP